MFLKPLISYSSIGGYQGIKKGLTRQTLKDKCHLKPLHLNESLATTLPQAYRTLLTRSEKCGQTNKFLVEEVFVAK